METQSIIGPNRQISTNVKNKNNVNVVNIAIEATFNPNGLPRAQVKFKSVDVKKCPPLTGVIFNDPRHLNDFLSIIRSEKRGIC